jgi:glycosyltransferase involved in cell wall biosynthesis
MSLLVNLAFVPTRPTGHAIYANQLVPNLNALNPILLTHQEMVGYSCYRIPGDMNPDYGTRGHLRRVLWTQFQLPNIYRQCSARLLFSPIPEMPLWSRCRSVVTLHDLIPLRFPRRSPLTTYFRLYIPLVLRQAQQVLCDSAATARDAMDYYQIPASKLAVVPLAHDRAHFRWLDQPTQTYFLYIGRHDPYKNLQRAIQAFAQLPRDYEFWIAGPADPRYTPLLQQQAAELGIGDRVRFLSYVPYGELPQLLNQAIALVFPSLWEGFGLPVLEAMACGTPVITSTCSSLPEVAGDAALLVDPYNVEALTGAMQALIRDAGLGVELRQKGLAQAAQFSWAKTGQMTAEILQRYL